MIINQIQKDVKMKLMTPTQIIKMGMEVAKMNSTMTESIKADVAKADANFCTPLTEKLTTMISTLEGNELKKLKVFIRTQIQPLIKTKKTQSDILGDDKVKTHKVTIKRVKQTHLKNDMVNGGKIKDELMVGTFRVIVEEKPQSDVKTFAEDMENLIKRHGKRWEDALHLALFQTGNVDEEGMVLVENIKDLK